MMNKIFFQGTYGAYSHMAALSIYPKAEIVPCKTFDECFLKASKDSNSKIIIPESNRITGNIGIEYLIFEYRLNIYSEYFQKIEHNLLGLPGTKITEIKNIYSHGQALSQCSNFIKSHNFTEHVRADTAGSAEMVSKNNDKTKTRNFKFSDGSKIIPYIVRDFAWNTDQEDNINFYTYKDAAPAGYVDAVGTFEDPHPSNKKYPFPGGKVPQVKWRDDEPYYWKHPTNAFPLAKMKGKDKAQHISVRTTFREPRADKNTFT